MAQAGLKDEKKTGGRKFRWAVPLWLELTWGQISWKKTRSDVNHEDRDHNKDIDDIKVSGHIEERGHLKDSGKIKVRGHIRDRGNTKNRGHIEEKRYN